MDDQSPEIRRSASPLPIRLAVIAAILVFVFVFPRAIVKWLGESSPWTSYLYQYGLGLVVFLVGIWVIRSSGACRPGRGRDGFWFKVLLAGYVFFALLHAVWILAALYMPYFGPQGG